MMRRTALSRAFAAALFFCAAASAVALSASAPPVAAAEPGLDALAAADAAYQAGDFEQAYRLYEQEAARRDADAGLTAQAQFALGFMQFYGEGVTQNPTAAARLFERAARAGNPDAQSFLGYMLLNGDGVQADPAAGRRWLEAAVSQGDAAAAFDLSLSFWGEDAALGPDPALARRYAEQAVRLGNPDGHRLLGYFALHGYGGPVDAQEAGRRFTASLEATGDPAAAYELAQLMRAGEIPEQPPGRARALLAHAVEQGSSAAMIALAELLVAQDGDAGRDQALALLWRAFHEAGDLDAATPLAVLLEAAERPGEARAVYDAAAEAGDAYAAYFAGLSWLDAEDAAQALDRARARFAQAAAGGIAAGHYMLGVVALDARAGAPDPQTAAVHWRRGAEAGDPSSMTELADLLMGGYVGSADYPEALRLLETARDLIAAMPDRGGYDLARILTRLASTQVELRRLDEAVEAATLALDLLSAEPTGAERAVRMARAARILAVVALYRGKVDEARNRARDGLRLLQQAPAESGVLQRISLHFVLGLTEEWAGAHASAAAAYRTGLELSQAAGESYAVGVAQFSVRLGRQRLELGDLDAAGRLIETGVRGLEAALGPTHPITARALSDRAVWLIRTGSVDAGLALAEQAFAIAEAVGMKLHPQVSTEAAALARALMARGRALDALPFLERATGLYREALTRPDADVRRFVRPLFLAHLDALAALGRAPQDAFVLAQLARAAGVGQAVRLSALIGAADPSVAEILRTRERVLQRRAAVSAMLVGDALTLPSGANSGRSEREAEREAERAVLIAERDRLGAEAAELSAALRALDPAYDRQAGLEPAPVGAVQAALRPGEGLLQIIVGARSVHLILTTATEVKRHRIALEADLLAAEVRALREALDQPDVAAVNLLRPFPMARAHRLYRALLGPFEGTLAGLSRLAVISDGPLESLPLTVLPTAPAQLLSASDGDAAPSEATGEPVRLAGARGLSVVRKSAPPKKVAQPAGDAFSIYRRTAWLGDRLALTRSPSVAAFLALRTRTPRAAAPEAFLGLGDPALGPLDAVEADPHAAVRALPALPETRRELAALARAFGADPATSVLGAGFNESAVRRIDLARYQVLAFATHGLIAGETAGAVEPSLVVTPPAPGRPNEAGDDGLLGLSEIRRFTLNADLVLLSACNTAAPDGAVGAEGLSGLARGFFQAGARALLVSHWSVFSDAAETLTVAMAAAMRRDGLAPGAALQRAMRTVRFDPSRPHFAHPSFWGAFTLVGDE